MDSTSINSKFIKKSEQKNLTDSENNSDFQSLLFVGNRQETVPVKLLTDKYLTSRAKIAWQLIKLNASQFQSSLFPSYDNLAMWLSDRAYQNKPISRKIVSQTLMLLRLTRWLTLCETVRNEQGQILGNVYIMNDEPLSIVDSITLNPDYLRLLEKNAKHKDPVLREAANSIIDEILHHSDKLWHFVSHIDVIKARIQTPNHHLPATPSPDLPSHLQEAIEKTQSILLSSHRELSEKPLSSNMELSQKNRELSKNTLSSNMELSPQKQAKSLILGLVPNGNLVAPEYSTSTNKNKYSTSTDNSYYQSLKNCGFAELEIQMLCNAIAQLPDTMRASVVFEGVERIRQGGIKNPAGYLFKLIQRAQEGQFKPYLQQKSTSTSEPISTATSHKQHGSRQLLSGFENLNNPCLAANQLENIRMLAKTRV